MPHEAPRGFAASVDCTTCARIHRVCPSCGGEQVEDGEELIYGNPTTPASDVDYATAFRCLKCGKRSWSVPDFVVEKPRARAEPEQPKEPPGTASDRYCRKCGKRTMRYRVDSRPTIGLGSIELETTSYWCTECKDHYTE